jgi:hypothetical protein
MLKEVVASNAAKLVAACVCPLAGAGVVALKVPEVRSAVHKATAPKPKPQREARAKPRVRVPAGTALAAAEPGPIPAAMMCPQPVMLQNASLEPSMSTPAFLPAPRADASPERVYMPANCPSVHMNGGGGAVWRFASVPEPVTWAQMIAGFGLMGGALRAGRGRRTRAIA